jgi:hypothetical protein
VLLGHLQTVARDLEQRIDIHNRRPPEEKTSTQKIRAALD